jgi:CelD/BcsL family acetyltransferase involved in cellulose biosynthesis
VVRITLVDRFAELEPRREAWNELARRAGTSTVFQTYEWHLSWWRVFGSGSQPFVLLAEIDSELVGIAPLMLTHRRVLGRRQRVVEFIGSRMSDYCDFLVPDTHRHVLGDLLFALDEHGFDLLHLRDFPGHSPTPEFLQRFFGPGNFVDSRILYEAPTRLFNDPESDRRLPNKKSLRRHYNYFRRTGALEFQPKIAAREMPQYLECLFEQHVARWALTDTPSLFTDERMRTFFRELAPPLAAKDWLLFSVVLFEGRPLALHFGFHYGDRIIWYKPAFDIAQAKRSPGEVLIKYLLEYALDSGVAQFDFTIGEDEFKYRFANAAPVNRAVRVFRRRSEFILMRLLLAAKAYVESVPFLARTSRRLVGRWRDHLWL